MKIINEALKYLENIFIDKFNYELVLYMNYERLKLLIFFLIIVVIFLGVWIPYIKTLMKKIWRTKGMLNMIPLNIICNNHELFK